MCLGAAYVTKLEHYVLNRVRDAAIRVAEFRYRAGTNQHEGGVDCNHGTAEARHAYLSHYEDTRA
jgi:hypothetical protein